MKMNRRMLTKLLRSHQVFAKGPNLCTWSPLGVSMNTRPQQKINLSLLKESTGLFGVPELNGYEGFYALKDKCIAKTDQLIKEAVSDKRERKLVEVFDELSDTLCQVADLAEFIRVAHPSGAYVQAAEIACATVSGLVEKLNTHRSLYQVLNNAVYKGDFVPMDDVDRHVSQLFLFDFEQCGIHLPEDERNKVVSLNDSILQLGQNFVARASKPREIQKQYMPSKIRHLFTTDGERVIVSGLNANSSAPLAREIAYRVFLHPDDHQEYLLTELLKARNELAQTCGFPTFADRALKGSVFDSPGTVTEFLNILSKGLKDRAKADFHYMSTIKKEETPDFGPLAPWDVPYFTQKIKKDKFKVSAAEYSPFFSLGACMEGLNNLFKCLYGITLENTEMEPGETWAPDVYKLSVLHDTDGLLGYIYCDFFERSGKPQQDCHFTIRGGKLLADGTYQLPIVVIMLNLPLPRWSSPSLLSPSMVDNLFHEMGHAMHSMLGRTTYQHVTGTRCSTDFAEVPSVLMEYFAADPRVIKSYARHFQTKEMIPDHMLKRLCASKNLFMASEMEIQVFYSVLDQIYHGTHPFTGTTTQVLEDVQNKYYTLPYVKHTAWQLRFSHLVGYGAKYYSYLVSRALASWIWQTYFEADPFSRVQGERYRRDCLSYGGIKPPFKLIGDFLQKEPTPSLLADSLIKEIDVKNDQLKSLTKL